MSGTERISNGGMSKDSGSSAANQEDGRSQNAPQEIPDETVVDEVEDEVEPQFGLKRLGSDVQGILAKEKVSCMEVHDRFLVLGTVSGTVYISTHLGNIVRKFDSHSGAVNQISISLDGVFIASCSNDGRVLIFDLSNGLQNVTKAAMEFPRPVKCVCIDPHFSVRTGIFFSGGQAQQLILSRKSFFSYKHSPIHSGEGTILAISWKGPFVAFATHAGVRVYDIGLKQIITYIEKPRNLRNPDAYGCSLYWESESSLLVGWEKSFKIAEVRVKANGSRYVQLVKLFQLDSVVCGVVPFSDDELALLFHTEEENELPEMRIINRKTGTEKSNDGLPLSNVDVLKPTDLKLVKGNDQLIFIVSPSDIIVASPRDVEDHIKWLFDHGEYEKAAMLLPEALSFDTESWERWISNFLKERRVEVILPHIPLANPQLSPTTYELVLGYFLGTDFSIFRQLIEKWPGYIYKSETIVNVLKEKVRKENEPIRREAMVLLALLYRSENRYEDTLSIYVKLKEPETFDFIKANGLEESVQDKIEELMDLDEEKALELVLTNFGKIPVGDVVRQLQKPGERNEYRLYRYLHGLFKKDSHAGEEYHGIQVQLYTKYDKSQLMSFLIQSDNYPLEQSYNVLKKENCYKEMVFILERMGNNSQALDLIINVVKDPEAAIDFVRRNNDDELWEKLIDESIKNVDLISVLLEHVGGTVDPVKLFMRIPKGMDIVNLKKKIVKIIADYTLQMSLREGCQTILIHDCVELCHRLYAGRCKSIHVTKDIRCVNCGEQIVKYPATSPVVVFFCGHCFHAPCLQDQSNCPLCNKQLAKSGLSVERSTDRRRKGSV